MEIRSSVLYESCLNKKLTGNDYGPVIQMNEKVKGDFNDSQ